MAHGVQGQAHAGEVDAAVAREVAQTMQALATPSRVRILARLRQSPCAVGELASAVEMERSAVSQQLRVLRHLGLVIGERRGRSIVYASASVPLGIAFYIRSFRAEKIGGLFVVATIFVSACVALYETIQRFINPEQLTHLWPLAAAGVIGFLGNEIAAYIRYRAGKRLSSPALIADGNHARVDGFVSLGVVVSAALVALGYPPADPIVALATTLPI